MLKKTYPFRNPIQGKNFCLALVMSLTAVVANATPGAAVQLIYSNPGNISKIEGLVVDGTTYDVTFKYDSFLNLFGSPNSSGFNTPTFWNNPSGAKNVADSIVSLLNSQQPVPTQINNYSSALLPYRGITAADGSLFIVNKIDNYIRNWANFRGESEDIFTRGNEQVNYAIFTIKEPSKSVPEPTSVASFAGVAFLLGATTLTRAKREQKT